MISVRARAYTVHARAGRRDRDLVLVRDGFSWGAFFFSFLWALWHRLWLFALVIVAVSVGVALLDEVIHFDPITEGALGLALALLIGFEANDARRRALARRGFDNAGLVFARGLGEAERRFFAKYDHPFKLP